LEEKMKKVPPAVPYEESLYEDLKDPKEAAAYLNAALDTSVKENDPDLFLLALYQVARARGFGKTADSAKIHRVSLNRMLSKGGNPEWRSLFKVLSASQLRLRVEPARSLAA
jgi:probable addiction module antidote protein